MRETLIISAFPACGKTYAAKYLSERGVDVLDSDSSQFSWITDENGNKVRNPRFIEEYIAHIKENIGKVDLIFVSSHKEVRRAMQKAQIDYTLVRPDVELKEQWVGRCFLRGNTPEFCKNLAEHWEEWIGECKKYTEKEEILRGWNGNLYLLDVLDSKAQGEIWQRQEQQSAFADWIILNRLEDGGCVQL